MTRLSCVFVTELTGLFLLLIGVGLAWFGTKSLIRMWAWELNCTWQKLTLKNGSEAMTRWTRPPHPLSMKVYIFNVTNPEAVNEGALPILSEIGPYVYEQSLEKVNIIQLDNFTLSYQLRNIIKFKQNLSGRLKESDLVTILNPPLAGAILSVYETVPEFVGILDDIWRFFFPGQNNIFITATVRDILFDGITIDCTSKITEVYIACRSLESRGSYSVRKEGKNFKFSFFHAKNGTSLETYQINQGIFDLKKSAQYTGMNYSPSVHIWKNYYCDLINGSDGAQFPVLLTKAEKLYIFEKELCRSVFAEFEKEINRKGVKLYKYSNTVSLFASPEENPDNKCFCRSPLNLKDLVEDEEGSDVENLSSEPMICFQNGVLPLMPCVRAPIVASFPHFYLGDQSYINYSGLNPVKDLHETFVQVEPISGMAVLGFKRLQFNVEVKRISDVQITSNLVDGLFPLLWVEERMELSPELFKLLRYSLIQKKILENGTFVLIGFGILLIISPNIARFFAEKSMCCETTRKQFIKDYRDLINKNEFEAFVQAEKPRLCVWQYSKPTISPADLINLKNSKIHKNQKNFLTDNFVR